MVTTPIDPMRVPSINLNEGELAEMEALIEQGTLPKDFLDRHFDAVDANVFGVDAPKDRKGFRLEQGIGTPGNMTANSIAAYIKYHGPHSLVPDPEEEFNKNVARMRADLAKCDAERNAKRGKGGKRMRAGRA